MAGRFARTLLTTVLVAAAASCHSATPTVDSAPPTIDPIFVYLTDSAVVALKPDLEKVVLFQGKPWASGSFLTGDSRYLVFRTTNSAVSAIDIRTTKVSPIACDCKVGPPVSGTGSDIYWWSQNSEIVRRTLGSATQASEVVARPTLPPPVPSPYRPFLEPMTTKLVAVTEYGYLVSRDEYLNSFGIPNILYLVDLGGRVTRLGRIASNRPADQYLVGPDGAVFYTANGHANNACDAAALGMVSTKTGTMSTVDLPAADCSQAVNIWATQFGEVSLLLHQWVQPKSLEPTPHANLLLKVTEAGITETGGVPVLETAINRQWMATIGLRESYRCGDLSVASPAGTTVVSSGVCRVLAPQAPAV